MVDKEQDCKHSRYNVSVNWAGYCIPAPGQCEECDRFESVGKTGKGDATIMVDKYTEEELRVVETPLGGYGIVLRGKVIADVNTENPRRDAQRLADCWNGCRGYNPSAVKEVVEACGILANLGFAEDGRVVERIMPSSDDILFAQQALANIKEE